MILKVHLPVFFFNLALPFSVDSSFSFLAFSSAASLSSHSLSSRSVLRSNQRPKAANGSNFLNQLDFLLFPDSLSFTTSGFSSLSFSNVSELATASFTLSAGSLFLPSLSRLNIPLNVFLILLANLPSIPGFFSGSLPPINILEISKSLGSKGFFIPNSLSNILILLRSIKSWLLSNVLYIVLYTAPSVDKSLS